jgi:hypothetical protein
MTLTIKTTSHCLRNGQNFALSMVAFVMFVTRVTLDAMSILQYLFIEEVDGICWSTRLKNTGLRIVMNGSGP